MVKLYIGNTQTLISSMLLIINLGYMIWGYLRATHIKRWGLVILIFVIINSLFWYHANVRDQYYNSIVSAIDGSAPRGLFSANSIQSLIYWGGTIIIWVSGLIAIFYSNVRSKLFFFIISIAFLQMMFIEGSRIWLYCLDHTRFNYM